MYLVELLVHLFFNRKNLKSSEVYNPFEKDELDNVQDCEHIFLPIDSTGKTLACSKCGLVVDKDKMKDKNIFRRSN